MKFEVLVEGLFLDWRQKRVCSQCSPGHEEVFTALAAWSFMVLQFDALSPLNSVLLTLKASLLSPGFISFI